MKLVLTLLFILLFYANSQAQDKGEAKKKVLQEKKRLEYVRSRIETEKKEIEDADIRERDLLKELDSTEIILDRRRSEVRKTAERLAAVNSEIDIKIGRIAELERSSIIKKEHLEKRMIALYKFGGIGPAKVIFSSDSYMSLLKRHRFMQLILENDAALIAGYTSDMEELNASLAMLEEMRGDTEKLKGELSAKKRSAEEELKRKRELLASIAGSKRLHEKALKELEDSSLELGIMIDRLEDALIQKDYSPGGTSFSALKGYLDFPAEGEVIAFFGKVRDPRFNTTVYQKGIEIAAPIDSEIRAVFDGKVIYADWFRGYGKIIIVDHGEGYYSLSAHTSEIHKKVGEQVNKGEVIALTGDTGSLKGPYLYFEIRHKGKPVDPLEWLKITSERTIKTGKHGREG